MALDSRHLFVNGSQTPFCQRRPILQLHEAFSNRTHESRQQSGTSRLPVVIIHPPVILFILSSLLTLITSVPKSLCHLQFFPKKEVRRLQKHLVVLVVLVFLANIAPNTRILFTNPRYASEDHLHSNIGSDTPALLEIQCHGHTCLPYILIL